MRKLTPTGVGAAFGTSQSSNGHRGDRRARTFPLWNGSGFVGGKGGAKSAERWNVGKRIRVVEEGPDGSLWMLEDANPGALIHVSPK